jgi:hypothetical protein
MCFPVKLEHEEVCVVGGMRIRFPCGSAWETSCGDADLCGITGGRPLVDDHKDKHVGSPEIWVPRRMHDHYVLLPLC